MRKAIVGFLGIFTVVVLSTEPPIWTLIVTIVILISVGIYLSKSQSKPKPLTNSEVAFKGELIGIHSANEFCINYKYQYKDKLYKLKYIGDLSLHNPNAEAKTI